MKQFIAAALAAASIGAQANMCGFPPFPPIGMTYVCVCNATGTSCHWVLVSK